VLDLPFEERICVLLHYAIQHCVLRAMTPIARTAGRRRRRANLFVLL
jgi:hypothetical protein